MLNAFRFVQTSIQKIPPNTSLESRKIEFTLARFEAANVYKLRVRILISGAKIGKLGAKIIFFITIREGICTRYKYQI